MIINLHTNVDKTRDFKRLLKQKAIEGAMLFVRDAIENKKAKIDAELIPQTSDYDKNAKLLIKGIRFK